MSFASRERRRLVDRLRREGAATDPRWLRAFRHVPRHVFLPRFYVPDRSRWLPVAAGDAGWLETCYSDSALVTQLDDDPGRWELAREEGPVCGIPTSSSSMPSIMAVMLEALGVRDGDRVLEVGTGTGYNAALLCHGLGDENVTTVDVDPAVLLPARAALASLGYAPRCEAADGERGLAQAAPYDRVLCTCSVSRIPPAWLEQCRPGGSVVTTLNRPVGAGLVRLTAGEGATGRGRVLPHDGRFMPMRAHRLPAAGHILAAAGQPTTTRGTALSQAAVLDPASPFEFFAGLALPGVAVATDPDDDACYLAHPDGSWAAHRSVDGEHRVEQGGPRGLWDLAEEAYELWEALGEPAREDFAVTVDAGCQEFRLGDHSWPLNGTATVR